MIVPGGSCAFAVLRLITGSNLTGNWIGRSLGFSPLNIRSTKVGRSPPIVSEFVSASCWFRVDHFGVK